MQDISPIRSDPTIEWPRKTVTPLLQSIISAGLVLQVMFLPNTGTLGVVAILACLGVLVTAFSHAMASRMLGSFPASTFWVLAVASTVWSAHPQITATYGLELMVSTMLAMVIGGISVRQGVLPGISAGFSIYLLVSVLAGGSVALGARGDEAFSGLTGSKNFLASAAGITVIATICALLEGLKDKQRVTVAGMVICVPLAVIVLFSSRSTGALIQTAAGLAVLFYMTMTRLLSAQARAALLLLIVTLIIFLVAILVVEKDVIQGSVLTAMGKDPTLTGRIYLWQRSDEIIAQSPWLGRGYYAFWVQGDLDPEGLWQWAGITSRAGFNFHSTWREIVVSFGWVGLGILAIATASALFSRLRDSVADPVVFNIFWAALLVYFLVAVAWEAMLPAPFNLASMMFIGAYSPLRRRREE